MKKVNRDDYGLITSRLVNTEKTSQEIKKTNDEYVESDLMRPKEVAKMLRMSEAWLKKRRQKGLAPAFLKFGGRIFYLRQVVLDMKKQINEEMVNHL